jgi:hypothetical protein
LIIVYRYLAKIIEKKEKENRARRNLKNSDLSIISVVFVMKARNIIVSKNNKIEIIIRKKSEK